MSTRTVVAIEAGGTVVGGDQHIQVAIVVKIPVSGAARHLGLVERLPDQRHHVAKLTASLIVKQMRRFRVADGGFDTRDGLVDVPVGHEQVQAAVEIDVKEETAEPEAEPARSAYR